MEGKVYITPEEVAEELRVNVNVVSAWLRKGMMRGIKVGKYWRIRPEDYRSFLEAQANIPPDPDSPRQNSQAPKQQSTEKKQQRSRSNLRGTHNKKSKGGKSDSRSP